MNNWRNDTRQKAIAVVSIIVILVLVCLVGKYVTLRQEIWGIMNTDLYAPEYYTPKSYANYQKQLDAAKNITSELFAEEWEIDYAARELQYSIKALLKYADKEPLQQVMDDIADLDAAAYIPISWEPLSVAVTAANTVMQNENAVDEDVLNAIQKIDVAIDGLIVKPDKTELQEDYTFAAGIDTSSYRPSTVSVLSEALSNAKAVLDNENSVEVDVESAISKIKSAVSGLDFIPDKTELLSVIDDAGSYLEEKYTTATYTVFQKTLDEARNIASNKDSTQNQVDSVIIRLCSAIDSLEKSTKCVWRISPYLHKVETNHVGNSWSSAVFYNGEQVRGSFEVTAREGAGVTLSAKAVENDKIPDVGYGSVYLTLKDENEAATTFYVRENRGRYAGNRAVWVLEVSCEIIERIG